LKNYLVNKEWITPLVSYGFVGVLVNASGYFLYLILTWLGLTPQLVVTFMYPVGAIYGYFAHAKLSFKYTGSHYFGIVKYVFIHIIGYTLNILMLHFLFEIHGYPHQLVQTLALLVVGIFLFVSFKYFVFSEVSPK
jgi:putative flippase GtrA